MCVKSFFNGVAIVFVVYSCVFKLCVPFAYCYQVNVVLLKQCRSNAILYMKHLVLYTTFQDRASTLSDVYACQRRFYSPFVLENLLWFN